MSWFEIFRTEEGRRVRDGEIVFRRGDAAACLFVIAEGEVEILLGSHQLEVLGPGSIFGELALVTGEPRSATARARSDCRLVEIEERRFLYLVTNTPFFALAVMRVLVERLRRRDPDVAEDAVS